MELENGNNVKIITKSSTSAQIFDVILSKYLYGRIVNLENAETRFIFDLMLVANEFELEKLTNKLETLLIDTKASCSDFTSLQESALVTLLKRDDLQTKEVEIWDYVINTDFFDKIRPYKKIIDKQLWEDINQYFLVSGRPVKSIILPARSLLVTELSPRSNEPKEHFSTIISEDHDCKATNYLTTNILYKFELILRETRDGFNLQIVVVKVKGTDEIIGGYNPLAWNNSGYKYQQNKFGPFFRCNDFHMRERSISTTRFSIVDYEVFKVRKS
ncbi:hypothetical protein Glove_89g84 [Diversispora epigaea]|uniref:TLDc domain-containing protein n=1 Tax=Diversispora epigaea TaxID=1348612 RepID=A0A397J5Q7_9GLOM|nr:hypothetical protein Glove_89g84 [Diversispora epigaea]